MKKPLLIAAIAAVALRVTNATAAELPTFELTGFPISPHQISVLGRTGIREQPAVPVLLSGEMQASPHQLAVLAPRLRITNPSASPTKAASAP